jgi:hypothetical protein
MASRFSVDASYVRNSTVHFYSYPRDKLLQTGRMSSIWRPGCSWIPSIAQVGTEDIKNIQVLSVKKFNINTKSSKRYNIYTKKPIR